MFSIAEQDLRAQHPVPAKDWSGKGIIIPTRNAASDWGALQASLRAQGIPPERVLIIDSSSSDGTEFLARASGYKVVSIAVKDFNHGATRQLACSYLPEAKAILFMTQDAILHSPESAWNLFDALNDPKVGVAYGRQLPRVQANPIERHARLFNYPAESYERTLESRKLFGMRAAFSSNSFAVYRRKALEEVGGFPDDVLLGEDYYVAARMLVAGWKLVYRADATVYHSHAFTVRDEFQRYFCIGAHHRRNSWMLETFGTANGEGKKFVSSELKYLSKTAPHLVPEALLRTFSKWVAYKAGSREASLPVRWKKMLSGNTSFW